MLPVNDAVRTLIAWFTLFFTWSALILWSYGVAIIKYLMSYSNVYAYDLAMRSVQATEPNMIPGGSTTFLLILTVLALGSLLATATVIVGRLINQFVYSAVATNQLIVSRHVRKAR